MCPGAVTAPGVGWQQVQSSGAAKACVPRRCDWCAPTPRLVVAVFPDRSRGGAKLAAEPWHELHLKVKSPLPAWSWQVVQTTVVTRAGGATAWHASQAAVSVRATGPWKAGLAASIQPAG